MEFGYGTKYVVVRAIARGGMGTVYEARQLGADGFEKRVALKVLRDDIGHDIRFNATLAEEAKLCADLVHENIVQIYQLGRSLQGFFIAMELIEGVPLRAFIERHAKTKRTVPAEIAAFIASRVCRALEYAHTRRGPSGETLSIVHRDVCPSNVLITALGVVKLGDFGVAKAVHLRKDEEGHVLLGKARYMSPEQAAFGQTDPRTDLFSLGVVLWEMLTGTALFAASTTELTLEAVQARPVRPVRELRPDVPEELAEILAKALARDREQRFAGAGEMGYRLEYYLYKDRFGPTNNTLRDYVAELFPELTGRTAITLTPVLEGTEAYSAKIAPGKERA
jgi:serine/threonine-protein kinase